MESALSVSSSIFSFLSISKSVNRRLSKSTVTQCLRARLLSRRLGYIYGFYGVNEVARFSSTSSSLRSMCAAEASAWCRRQCVSSSTASFASGGGNGGFGGENGGGGGGQSGSDGNAKLKLAVDAGDEALALSSKVIILDVGVCVSLALPIVDY